MKTKIFLFSLSFTFFITAFAQIDRTKPPKPGSPPEIKLGEYQSFQLSNGLKVFVVENHKLPRVAFSLVVDRDPIVEGGKAGYVSASGELLRTGTKTRTKAELDKEIDFIGATFSTSSDGVFAMSLREHTDKLIKLISDVVLNADFKQDELDKIKLRMKSDLAASKDDPDAIASIVRNVIAYGKNHPYGEPMVEATVDSFSLEDCKNFYTTFFRPNISYLAVVGDITINDAKPLIEKYFGTWEKKDVPKFNYEIPLPPSGIKVAVVDRPNSVQSVINVVYPVQLKPSDKDVIDASVMNTMLGGGVFRLFENLREKHGYTYGAYSSLNKDELVGSFNAFASVRNEVTDSAVTQILYEMKRMRDEKVSDKELQSVKNYITGNFAISLEQPQTVATFAINIERYNLPKDYYKNYLKNLAKVSADDVQNTAKEYMKPDSANILVVGNADQIEKSLSSFGQLNYYDMYGNIIEPGMFKIPEGLTPENVIDNYIEAIGGRENFDKIQDRTTEMTGKVQGFDVRITAYQKAPNLFRQDIEASGMDQNIIYNGEAGAMLINGNKQEITGSELEKLKYEATLDLLLNLDSLGINLRLAGIEKVNNKDSYKIEMVLPSGTKWIQYFDPETGLKVKESKSISAPQGNFTQEIFYEDYREVEGVKYPFTIKQTLGPQSFTFTVDSIKVNSGVEDEKFEIK